MDTTSHVSSRNPAVLLSEEAQDLILEHVRLATAQSNAPHTARRTYASFCLVTRHWLSSGRRALYRNPFLVDFKLVHVAESLVQSLESNVILARCVRDLDNLSSTSDRLYGQDLADAWSFAVRVTSACICVNTLAISLHPFFWAQTSQPKMPRTLRVLRICIRNSPHASVDVVLIWIRARGLERNQLQSFTVEKLRIDAEMDEIALPANRVEPSLPLPIRKLVINSSVPTDADIVRLLPLTSSRLLDLTLCADVSDTTAARIAALCPNLRHLTIETAHFRPYVIPHVATYNVWTGFPISSTLVASFRRLEHLTLHGVSGMVMTSISGVIAVNEDCLRSIDLQGSTWNFGSFPTPLSEGFKNALPALISLVHSLPTSCTFVHLGILPIPSTKGTKDAWQLEEAAREKGIKLAFDPCADMVDGELDICLCEECVSSTWRLFGRRQLLRM